MKQLFYVYSESHKAYAQRLGNQQAPQRKQSLEDNMDCVGSTTQTVEQKITAFYLEISNKV
jgi:hypothetical protein